MVAFVSVCFFVIDVAAIGASYINASEEGSAFWHRIIEVDTMTS